MIRIAIPSFIKPEDINFLSVFVRNLIFFTSEMFKQKCIYFAYFLLLSHL